MWRGVDVHHVPHCVGTREQISKQERAMTDHKSGDCACEEGAMGASRESIEH